MLRIFYYCKKKSQNLLMLFIALKFLMQVFKQLVSRIHATYHKIYNTYTRQPKNGEVVIHRIPAYTLHYISNNI